MAAIAASGAERHTSMLEAKQSDTPRMIALIHSLHNCKQLFVNEQAINACLSRNHIYEVEFIIDFLPLIDGRYTQLCCWVTPYILYTVSGVT